MGFTCDCKSTKSVIIPLLLANILDRLFISTVEIIQLMSKKTRDLCYLLMPYCILVLYKMFFFIVLAPVVCWCFFREEKSSLEMTS